MMRFLRCRGGGAAILIGLAMIPVTLAAGAAIDLGQSYFGARSLQGVVDAAALAGIAVYTEPSATKRAAAIAAATAFFNKGAAGLSGLTVGTPTVTAEADATCTGTSAAATVSVSAPVTIRTTIMGAVVDSVTTTVSATAKNPLVEFSLDLGGFQPGPDDGDKLALHWFKAPAAGGAPANADLHFIANNVTYPAGQVYRTCVFAEEQIGLALEVWPGGIDPYYSDSEYGGNPGDHNYYYSNIYPPNSLATGFNATGRNRNCSLQIAEMVNGTPNPVIVTGKCFSVTEAKPFASLAPSGTVSCAGLNGRTVRFEWNDMGPSDLFDKNGKRVLGPSGQDPYYDDKDYDDLMLSFTCPVPDRDMATLTH